MKKFTITLALAAVAAMTLAPATAKAEPASTTIAVAAGTVLAVKAAEGFVDNVAPKLDPTRNKKVKQFIRWAGF